MNITGYKNKLKGITDLISFEKIKKDDNNLYFCEDKFKRLIKCRRNCKKVIIIKQKQRLKILNTRKTLKNKSKKGRRRTFAKIKKK